MVASTPDGSLAVTVLLKCGWAIAAAAVSSVSVTVAVMALVIAWPPVPPAESIAATQPRWWPQAGQALLAAKYIYRIDRKRRSPSFLKQEAADALHADRQRQARDRGRPRRHAAALGAPRRARPQGPQVRLRHRAMRRVHGASQRCGRALVHPSHLDRSGQDGDDDRGALGGRL